jgi:hypothetical protein
MITRSQKTNLSDIQCVLKFLPMTPITPLPCHPIQLASQSVRNDFYFYFYLCSYSLENYAKTGSTPGIFFFFRIVEDFLFCFYFCVALRI